MKKLAIFDFDGTLVDSMTDVALCFNEALAQCGFAAHPIENYAQYVGGNLEQVISRLLPETDRTQENVLKIKGIYRELYMHSPKPNTKPYPGICSLLEELGKKQVRLAVNTNKSQALTDKLMQTLFSEYTFFDVIGYREGVPAKPDPYGVNALLSAADILPGEAAYVGDGESDIATAWAAGVPMVFVTWGQGAAVDYCDPRISKVVHTPQEILTYMLEDHS